MLNEWMQLVPLPSAGFRTTVLVLLVIDVIGTFTLDRIMTFIFVPEILRYSMGTWRDAVTILKTFSRFAFYCYMAWFFIGDGILQGFEELDRQAEAAAGKPSDPSTIAPPATV